MSTKAIIFCRVSSKEQEETGYSLDAQYKLLAQYADKRGFVVVKTFKVSESASGKQARTMFYEMLAFVQKHDINAICVEKIDRLTRNLKDAAIVNEWVQENDGHELHFVKENAIINKSTRAHENFVWDMKVAIARFYTNNLSEEVRKGQREKLAQGWLPTKPPLGYTGTGDKGYRTHIIDTERAPLVRRMFELYSTGNYSVDVLVGEMYRAGLRNRAGKKLGRARMHALLTDPFYHGTLRWRGEFYAGKQEPLISRMLFDSVQQRLKGKMGSSQQRKHLPVFKGKIRCGECAGTITWEIQKTHWYGHCNHYKNCSQRRWWRQEDVEAQLLRLFDMVAPGNERVLRILEKAVGELGSKERDEHTTAYASATRVHESAQRKLDVLYDDRADGKITPEFYERKRKEYARGEADALASMKRLEDGMAEYHQAATAIHDLAAHAAEIYQSEMVSAEEKRLLLSKLFVSLSLSDDGIRPTYTAACQFLYEWMPSLNETFEPLETGSTKTLDGESLASYPVMPHELTSKCTETFEPVENGSIKMRKVDSWASYPVVLAWREAFRMFDWQNAIGDPELTLREVKQLLSICDRVAVAVG